MLRDDYAAFTAVMTDLCAAFDKPVTDDRVRVFWETLKHVHLHDVKRSAEAWKRNQRKFPTPRDLMPERATAPPPKSEVDAERWSSWAMAANKILFACAYEDDRRGFRPVALWNPTPKRGWLLPLRPSKHIGLLDGSLLEKCLAVKRDYVRMAEEAEAAGEAWNIEEFNRMCREGFEKLLA